MRTLIQFIGQYSSIIRWLYWKLSDRKYLWGISMFILDDTNKPNRFKKESIKFTPGEEAAAKWLNENIEQIFRVDKRKS